jgi:hypothetical protein
MVFDPARQEADDRTRFEVQLDEQARIQGSPPIAGT